MINLLYQDNHLLVVNKPALLPTMGVGQRETSLIVQAKAYLKKKHSKPGNVYLGVVSRLDAMVSGVIVLAKTSKAASRLTDQFRERQVRKTYWAVVHRPLPRSEATLHNWLVKDDRARRMRVCPAATVGALEAQLSYRTLQAMGQRQLLGIELITGRKHQIRVQLAHLDRPILGDKKYGSQQPFPTGIALHSRVLSLIHPVTKESQTFVAPVPPCWLRLGIDQGDLRP